MRTPIGAVGEALRAFSPSESSGSLLRLFPGEMCGVIAGGEFYQMANRAAVEGVEGEFLISGSDLEELSKRTDGAWQSVVHTHPSGNGKPSSEDVYVLQKVAHSHYGMQYGVIVTDAQVLWGLREDASISDVPEQFVSGIWTEYALSESESESENSDGVEVKSWKVRMSTRSVIVDRVDL